MAKAYRPLPDAELLWETFDYNPLTGRLHWLRRTSNRIQLGEPAGVGSTDRGYVKIRLNGLLYLGHRLTWKWCYGTDPVNLDHINGNPSDNRIWNLRECDQTLNNANAKTARTNRSGFKGVCWSPSRSTWIAQCANQFLGHFNTPEQAHAAYCAKATELFGPFHRPA
jgi:hypothetical protein